MCARQRVRRGRRFWDRLPMFEDQTAATAQVSKARPGAPTLFFFGAMLAAVLMMMGCHGPKADKGTVVFLIESSPTSLDPRIGTDAQSEHIDELLFDGLVVRDASFRVEPGLAERWEQPDPLTLIFHLHAGVHFSDGRRLTSRDVVWTLNSMR